MANTGSIVGVERADTPQDVGVVLSGLMVVRRRKDNVGVAANHFARPCSDPRAAHVRSEMQREGGSPHWEGIMALDKCDLEDGVSKDEVKAVHLRALAQIDAWAPEPRAERPIKPLLRLEARNECQLRVDGVDLAAHEEDARALQAVIRDIDREAETLAAMRATCEHRLLTITRGATEPSVGRRRGALAMVQS